MSIDDARVLHFRRIADPKGNLTPVEGAQDVPFDIARVFYLYDVPGGASRGGHAHRRLHQVIIAASGSFEVVLDDGGQRASHFLNRPYEGLYVPPMTWAHLENFSSGSVCLVLASTHYEEADYFREYQEFVGQSKVGS